MVVRRRRLPSPSQPETLDLSPYSLCQAGRRNEHIAERRKKQKEAGQWKAGKFSLPVVVKAWYHDSSLTGADRRGRMSPLV